MMMQRLVFIWLFLSAFAGSVFAQQDPEAEALLSRNQIRIGEQLALRLKVHYREGMNKAVVTWPALKDTITYGIDIVSVDTIQTKLVSPASVLYEQSRTVVITAYDSGLYYIPPQQFVVDQDTIYTNELQLYVSTVPVDTTKPIKDIRDIYDVPPAPAPPAKDVNWWLWGGAVAVVLAITAFLVYYLNRKKKAALVPAPPGRQVLPHEKILEELAELGRRKPWLNGELKAYHISLTEILRRWIVERYRIHALEMTTGEIAAVLNGLRIDYNALQHLERVLRTADMVKFAKSTPGNDENEYNLQLAISFVQATAVIPQPQLPVTPYP